VRVTSPFIIRARGETSVRIGLVDPITGVYAAIAQGEVEGARLAADRLNRPLVPSRIATVSCNGRRDRRGRTLLKLREMEAPPCHTAGVIARQAGFANLGSRAVDGAGRGDADFPDQRGTAIAAAPHPSVFVIEIGAGDLREIGVRLQ